MSFTEWFFGGIDNPRVENQWGPLHIATLVVCVGLILAFYFIVKRSKAPQKVRTGIVCTLAGAIAFFEVMSRFMYFMKLYYFHQPEMNGTGFLWILLPKPWCAVSCWLLIACVFVKKPFFYNFASLSALLCSFIFFCYPGPGYNNVHLLFDNWYSILTHALLLVMSITLITLKFTDFRYREIWKLGIGFLLTFVYGLLQIYVLKTQTDPMYFMPHGDIQEGILGISYGLYLFLYITLLLIYVNAFYLIQDRENVKGFFRKISGKSKIKSA